VLTGTLADLAELAQQAVSPSLIVIGEVVACASNSPGLANRGKAGQGGHDLKLVSLA
jgi:uroporphyrin-III C-methyltransferase/precorrin-2 dehydrogenase/sirohydrochlorin ferrochelatase